jgi:hypothetical protein
MDATDGEAFGIERRLERAATALRRERRRTADEFEALRTFEERVREIETETTVSQGGAVARVGVAAGPTDGLDSVREAYEETVMSAPHYDEEYGDSYVESLGAELSPDLAAALTDGTRFNARCKRALLSAAGAARSARESLLGTLSGEAESLEAAAEALSPVAEEVADLSARSLSEAPFGTLDAYRARLTVLEENCEAVAEERQATLFEQRRTAGLPTDAPDVPQYVYQELPFDYPVMSAVADLTAAVGRVRDDVESAMARC